MHCNPMHWCRWTSSREVFHEPSNKHDLDGHLKDAVATGHTIALFPRLPFIVVLSKKSPFIMLTPASMTSPTYYKSIWRNHSLSRFPMHLPSSQPSSLDASLNLAKLREHLAVMPYSNIQYQRAANLQSRGIYPHMSTLRNVVISEKPPLWKHVHPSDCRTFSQSQGSLLQRRILVTHEQVLLSDFSATKTSSANLTLTRPLLCLGTSP